MNSTSGIKIHCDEYLNMNLGEEHILKILCKFSSILKISEKFQKDFFIHLSDKGLNKLLNAMKDNNIEIRKASCRVLLELLNNNEVLQNIFCEKFNFNPIGNVICLNWLPKDLKENLKIDARVLIEIKNSINTKERPMRYWMWPCNDKYTDENIPDPQKYLIGFYYANKNSYYNNIQDDLAFEHRIDTKILTTKLENDYIDDVDKYAFVAAGSGSESSAKIKESLKRVSNEFVEQPLIKKQEINVEEPDKKVIVDNKKMKEDYKKNIKDKLYSKSIDTNIKPKQPLSNNAVHHNINQADSNRIKIGKVKK